MQEAVLARSALHNDVVGELEPALERAGRDTLIEDVALVGARRPACGAGSGRPRAQPKFPPLPPPLLTQALQPHKGDMMCFSNSNKQVT